MNKKEKVIPFNAEERAELRAKIRFYHQELDRLEEEGNDKEWKSLFKKLNEIENEYEARHPRREFGRCPFCYAAFKHTIDPFGYDGGWWSSMYDENKKTCEHQRVIRCAIDLKGQQIQTCTKTIKLGPAVPYVIPRLLELPDVVCVISEMKLEAGYIFYPIIYYSKGPIDSKELCPDWAESQWGWEYITDRWDFDLRPWVESGHVRWCDFNDKGQAVLQPKEPDLFPFYDLPGHRGPQVAANGELYEHDLPPESRQKLSL
jgi:hypothetical protein